MLIASMFKHWVVVKKKLKNKKIHFHDVHIMLLTLISYRKYNKSWIFFTIIIPPIILSTFNISLIDFVTFWVFFWLFSRLSARTIKSKKSAILKSLVCNFFFDERTVVGWRLLNLPLHFFSRVIIDFLFGLLGNLPPPFAEYAHTMTIIKNFLNQVALVLDLRKFL